MADDPQRIGPVLLTNAAATIYTAPALTTTILRSILVANENNVTRTFTLSIGADALGTRLFDQINISGRSVLSWSGFLPIEAAEIIQAYASANNALQITIGTVEVS